MNCAIFTGINYLEIVIEDKIKTLNLSRKSLDNYSKTRLRLFHNFLQFSLKNKSFCKTPLMVLQAQVEVKEQEEQFI